jgi:hypothetical protein
VPTSSKMITPRSDGSGNTIAGNRHMAQSTVCRNLGHVPGLLLDYAPLGSWDSRVASSRPRSGRCASLAPVRPLKRRSHERDVPRSRIWVLRLGTGRHGADQPADARDASGTAPPWFAPPGETTGSPDGALAKVSTLGGRSRGSLPFRERFHAGVAAAHANSPTDSHDE